MPIRFKALETPLVQALQGGGTDSYGHPGERRIAGEFRVPCRHCLREVDAGDPYLTVAHRPFSGVQPYAETGPIFIHANACDRAPETGDLPPMLSSPAYILRGYDSDERMNYDTAGLVPREQIVERAAEILADPAVAFVHVRSATATCFQCRIERA